MSRIASTIKDAMALLNGKNIKGALALLSANKNVGAVRTLKYDPELAQQIEAAEMKRAGTGPMPIMKIYMRNFHKLAGSMGFLGARMFMAENNNGARTWEDKNEIVVAQLKELGLPVETGAAPTSEIQKLASRSSIKPPVAAIPTTLTGADATLPALAAALPAAVEAALPVLMSAIAHTDFSKLTTVARAEFAERGGQIKRSEIESYKPAQLSAFFRAGGTVAHDVAPAQRFHPSLDVETERASSRLPASNFNGSGAGGKSSRLEFDSLTPAAKMEFVKANGKITDK